MLFQQIKYKIYIQKKEIINSSHYTILFDQRREQKSSSLKTSLAMWPAVSDRGTIAPDNRIFYNQLDIYFRRRRIGRCLFNRYSMLRNIKKYSDTCKHHLTSVGGFLLDNLSFCLINSLLQKISGAQIFLQLQLEKDNHVIRMFWSYTCSFSRHFNSGDKNSSVHRI